MIYSGISKDSKNQSTRPWSITWAFDFALQLLRIRMRLFGASHSSTLWQAWDRGLPGDCCRSHAWHREDEWLALNNRIQIRSNCKAKSNAQVLFQSMNLKRGAIFDGNCAHEGEPFKGERYSMIFFNSHSHSHSLSLSHGTAIATIMTVAMAVPWLRLRLWLWLWLLKNIMEYLSP